MQTRAQFMEAFAIALDAIRGSEQITKRELRDQSRVLLSSLHGLDADPLLTGDIQFINQLIGVLTPVNKKVAVLFFTHFAGFHMDPALGTFTKKSAKRYTEAKEAAAALLADPNQNIWTWADREVHVEAKPFTLTKVTTFIEGALKKAPGVNLTQADILRAVFAGGITPATIMQVVDQMAADAKAREDAAAPF